MEKEVFDIKMENKKIMEENKNLKDKIKNIEEIITKLQKYINDFNKINKEVNSPEDNKIWNEFKLISSIIRKDEFNTIKTTIEERMNKKIKEIKKLYQATVDGESGTTFHEKCDNIHNTLVLIESAGNRRFGGFASECWKSDNHIYDNKCFLFSLDKMKIYLPKKNNHYNICNYKREGPNFSYKGKLCIMVGENVIKNKELKTYESNNCFGDLFDNDKNALSEDGQSNGIYAKEYEVFQIIFE